MTSQDMDLWGLLCLTEDEMKARADAIGLGLAWREWEMHSCVERHGGHLWVLTGDHPDEGGQVTLGCSYCPADAADLSGCEDPSDLVVGEVNGITIEYGVHDGADEFEVPVRAELVIEKYGPNLDMIYAEYDVWIVVTPR